MAYPADREAIVDVIGTDVAIPGGEGDCGCFFLMLFLGIGLIMAEMIVTAPIHVAHDVRAGTHTHT